MDDVRIRTATPDDAPEIRELARESWHAAYDEIVGERTVEEVVDDWYDLERLAASTEREDGRFLLAETDDRLVGFGQGVVGDDAAELPRLYVHPDRWGEGVGTELIARIESWAADRGAERLRLVVLADNEVGNAFYEKRGYRTVGSRESEFRGETYTDYVREKEL